MGKKAKKTALKAVSNFITETGLLKATRRSGWSVVGVANAESVADHSFRCSIIGFFLARMEQADPYKTLLMTLFNDVHEARIGDLHKMAQRYIRIEKGEDQAFDEQISALPALIKQELALIRKEYRQQRSRESIVARDADILECLIQAKEYSDGGAVKAAQFMKKAPRFLKSKSAKALWTRSRQASPDHWWLNLTEFKR